MATITKTNGLATGTMSETTLGTSDTFVFTPNKSAIMILRNATAGALTPNFDGSGGTTVPLDGVGSVDVSAGYTTASIAAGAVLIVKLDAIRAYLNGTIALTGGTGIVASILEF